MIVSVYLWVTEGLTERNLAILYAAGDAIAAYGGPWIIAGDFNVLPIAQARCIWLHAPTDLKAALSDELLRRLQVLWSDTLDSRYCGSPQWDTREAVPSGD